MKDGEDEKNVWAAWGGVGMPGSAITDHIGSLGRRPNSTTINAALLPESTSDRFYYCHQYIVMYRYIFKILFSYQPKQQFINSLALGSPISHKSISVQFICLHILYYVAFDLDGETDGLTDRQSPKSLLDVLIWSHWWPAGHSTGLCNFVHI